MDDVDNALKAIEKMIDQIELANPKSQMSKENLESLCMQKINYLCANFQTDI